jgi:asparagine synthase (glutamine-hydrolysing)
MLVRPERAALLPKRPDPPLPQTEREAHAQSLYVDDAATGAVLAEINHLAAADGMERRHPFYDRRVLEYCLALPPTQKLRHGWTRWVLRTAMAPDMPPAIRWRAGKSDLAPTFERNLLRDAAPRLDAAAAHPQLSDYLAPGAVAAARARGDATTCWRVLGVAAWFDAWFPLAASSVASSSPLRQDVSPLVDASYSSSLPATVS